MTIDGEEWLTTTQAARRARIRPATLHVWHHRGRIRGHRIGRTLYLAWPDVVDAEHAWRTRTTRTDPKGTP